MNEHLVIPLALRARRIITTAAELIEEQAATLKASHTINGEYMTCGEGRFWDPDTGYDQGRNDVADLISLLDDDDESR